MTKEQKETLKAKLEAMKKAREEWEKTADAPQSSFKGGRKEWDDSFQSLWAAYNKSLIVLQEAASHHIEELIELATKEV